MTTLRRHVPLLLLAPLLLPGCGGRRSSSGGGVVGPPAVASLRLEPVASGFDFPVLLLAPPADTSRLFIVEKGGTVRIIKNGAVLAASFLDIQRLVSTQPEQGLLGMAFEPDYSTSGRFIISYTNTSGDTRIVRYHVSSDPDVAHPAADEVLLAVDQPAENHNGGMLAFGPDGMLWIGLGDGGGGNDTYDNGQSKDDLLGSMLRIDVSGASGYTIPAGNPYSAPDRPELWNIGLRNPWRWSFDRLTGDLYIGDVGQGTWEEIDVAPAATGRAPGANYGWPIMEGEACLPPGTGCATAGLTFPVLDYPHNGACSVTGGYVYRGSRLAGVEGTYFYADFCGHWVRSFRLMGVSPTEQTSWPALDPGSEITSFGEDARGELYVLSADGSVNRIVAAP
ncbi:MAG: PQQ-dependent sugar dehydrogenase [Candidatus Eisenbacteria bacterium]